MTQTGVSANRLELLQIAESVAREKSIDRTIVIAAMEDAIQKAAKSRYGSENEIRAEISPDTGEILLTRLLEIVETVTMEATQISLKEARRHQCVAAARVFVLDKREIGVSRQGGRPRWSEQGACPSSRGIGDETGSVGRRSGQCGEQKAGLDGATIAGQTRNLDVAIGECCSHGVFDQLRKTQGESRRHPGLQGWARTRRLGRASAGSKAPGPPAAQHG